MCLSKKNCSPSKPCLHLHTPVTGSQPTNCLGAQLHWKAQPLPKRPFSHCSSQSRPLYPGRQVHSPKKNFLIIYCKLVKTDHEGLPVIGSQDPLFLQLQTSWQFLPWNPDWHGVSQNIPVHPGKQSHRPVPWWHLEGQ